jgi:ABC-2 type transport system permease protein
MLKRILYNVKDIWDVFAAEVRRVFSDKTTVVIFFLATVVYPPLYYYIYHLEMLTEMPVAVVDLSQGKDAKRFVHKLDATPEVKVAYRCANLADAELLLREHEVRSIFLLPKDYDDMIAHKRTGTVTVVTDISSFIYYKNALMGGSNVLLDEMKTTQLEFQASEGVTGVQAETTIEPVGYEDVKLYNPTGGYASYFIPALLMLVVHQTLFFGICVLCGDANENRKALRLIPPRLRAKSVYRVTLGRLLCFLFIYFPITLLDLWIIPYIFGMPQLGHPQSIMLIVLPYVIAITCFAMTLGNIFARERLSMLLCCLFFSVILFFLSGVVWPHSNMPKFWYVVSYLFPSTPGIQGFVRISSMGATLNEVRHELMALWLQAGVYFGTACMSIKFIKHFNK